MIIAKCAELNNLLSGLMGLSQVKLKARVTFLVVKAMREIQAEIKLFEEARLKLIADFSKDGKPEIDTETNQYILTDTAGFTSTFQELRNQDIEINIEKTTIKIPENLQIAPLSMEILLWLAENDDIFEDNKGITEA